MSHFRALKRLTTRACPTHEAGIRRRNIRPRTGGYGEAAAKALPHVTQVADRWHLIKSKSCLNEARTSRSEHSVGAVSGATFEMVPAQPPSDWIEDFDLKAVDHARHTRKTPGIAAGGRS
jgi:hypothetical protein